jgi:hypothetical protein
MNILDKIIDVNGAAEILKIDPRNVREFIKNKLIEGKDYVQFGSFYIIVKDSLKKHKPKNKKP